MNYRNSADTSLEHGLTRKTSASLENGIFPDMGEDDYCLKSTDCLTTAATALQLGGSSKSIQTERGQDHANQREHQSHGDA